MLKSINPYTQGLIKQYPENTLEELDEKVKKSEEAFRLWKTKSFAERAELFYKLSEILLADKAEYAKLITSEMGKPLKETIAEVEKCAEGVRYYADNAATFLKPTIIKTDAKESYVVYEPLGPVLALMPWNFPFLQVFRFAAPAMNAGNNVMLKIAPNKAGYSKSYKRDF